MKLHPLLVAALIALLQPVTMAADNAKPSPKNYGTERTLRTCPDRSQPSKGPISVAQAKAYVACSYEDKPPYNAAVRFVDVQKLEIASNTRPVNTQDIMRWPQINQHKPIYVLQGAVVVHSCANIAGSQKVGSNCIRYDVPKAIGTCWQDQFAAWFCFLGGPTAKETRQQPAPG
jgi:hypothetical protein